MNFEPGGVYIATSEFPVELKGEEDDTRHEYENSRVGAVYIVLSSDERSNRMMFTVEAVDELGRIVKTIVLPEELRRVG